MPAVRQQDVDNLIEVLAPYTRALILTHNNPDPDALAAAAALRVLIRRLARIQASIGYAGFLTRAENKEMVSRLRLPVRNIERMDLRRFRAAVLVDTQPGAGNNALSERLTPVAVVDHHHLRRATLACPFRLVDPKAGATSTIVFEMLKCADMRVSSNIATALFLGIRTDTQDLGREATKRDLAAYRELFELTSHSLLAQIEHPRVSSEYFRVVHRALETAVICGDCLYAPIGDVPTPESVSEVADYLVALRGIRWAVATGRFEENLYFSTRTLSARKDAGRLLRKAMGRLGVAGGHRKMAGGVLPLGGMAGDKREATEARVISSLFEALGANTAGATPLLARTGRSH